MWPYPDEVDEGVVDVGAAGQEEAAAGAELVEEEELLLLRGRGGENVTAGGRRHPSPQKSRALFLFQGSKSWLLPRAHPADAAVVAESGRVLRPLPGLQLLAAGEGDGGDALQRAALQGVPPKSCRALRGEKGAKGEGGGIREPGWLGPQPRVPRPAELTVSTRRAPISPVCPRRGPRQSCSRGPHLRGRRTDKRTRQMDRRTQQAAASPPCPKQPTDVTRDTRRSPIDGGRGGRHLLLDALQLEAVVLGGGARRVAEVSTSSEWDVLGEGTPEGGVSP